MRRVAVDGMLVDDLVNWLYDEKALLVRARQIIEIDERDKTRLFPCWIEFLLFGAPYGGFNLNSEPEHDARKVFDLKEGIDRDAFRRIDWGRVTRLVDERCNCEHQSHFDGGGGHPHMGPGAGDEIAQYVGRVCDDCAATHMKSYLVHPRSSR
jgi:hypothetical protein